MLRVVGVGTRGFPHIQGGVEKHCEELYTHLVQLGCEVTVIVRKPYINENYHEIVERDDKTFHYKGVRLIPLDCPRNKYLETFVHTFKGVLKARALNPDIVHIHAIGPSLFTPLARVLGMRVVMTHHGPDYKREKWPMPAKIFLMFCEMIGVRFSNRVITISEGISQELLKRYGVKADVIPNGVTIHRMADGDETIKRFNLEKDRYILTVGRFVPEKGFDDLIEAFTLLQNSTNIPEIKKLKLVIIGDADHQDRYCLRLKAMARENRNVVLTGLQTGHALVELYTHARLFVLPSYYEGLPIALLEAMSYGLSCIASDIPANREVGLGEKRFFKAGDIDSLCKKLSEFLINKITEDERKTQIDMVSNRYSWKRIAEKTLRCYEEVTGSRDEG